MVDVVAESMVGGTMSFTGEMIQRSSPVSWSSTLLAKQAVLTHRPGLRVA